MTPGATAIANIGWRYFVVFACLTLVSVVVIYFCYPETNQKSLEELAAYFGEKVVTVESGDSMSADKTAGHEKGAVDYAEQIR